MINKAFKLYINGQLDEAITLVQELLVDDIECAKCYRILAYIYDDRNIFDLAERNYTLAVNYNSNDAGFYLARASFYFKNSLFEDAINDYSYIINNINVYHRSISLDTAYFQRSLAHCCLGNFDIVLEDFNKYKTHMEFTYLKPIIGKLNKDILFKYATNKEKFQIAR